MGAGGVVWRWVVVVLCVWRLLLYFICVTLQDKADACRLTRPRRHDCDLLSRTKIHFSNIRHVRPKCLIY